jgi:hypothetical protein
MPDNLGSQADPRVVDPTADATITALLKGLLATHAAKAAATTNQHEPAADTAAIVTKAAAGAGISHVLALVAWSYDGDPTAGSLTIVDGAGTTVFKADITAAGPGFFPFLPPLKGTANTALVATLAAGGSGISGIVNVHTWTE